MGEKDKSPFVINSKKLFNQNVFALPLIILLFFFPKLGTFLVKIFKISFFPRGVLEFFTNVVKQMVNNRTENEGKHTDLLQMMISSQNNDQLANGTANGTTNGTTNGATNGVTKETTNGITNGTINGKEKVHKPNLNNNELIAQGILFFLAGYETVSSSLAMLFYCLADNPDHQEKLFEEIEQMCLDSDVGYEQLVEMPYLNMCIEESLRLYAPAPRVDRLVTKETGVNLGSIHMPKYSAVIIPVESIHHDPEIYPEPEKFIPERFSPEQKANRNVVHYLPFGYGPRSCIAMRLALVQMKMAAVHVVRNFKLSVGSKTKQPITFVNNGQMHVQGGLYLKLVPRMLN